MVVSLNKPTVFCKVFQRLVQWSLIAVCAYCAWQDYMEALAHHDAWLWGAAWRLLALGMVAVVAEGMGILIPWLVSILAVMFYQAED